MGHEADRGDGPPEELDLRVPDMDCASCADTVTASVERVEGVEWIDAQPATGRLVVHVDPALADRAAVVDAVEAAGYAVADGTATVRLTVPDMDCASCAETVGAALADTDGVTDHETMPTSGTLRAVIDPDRIDADGVVAAVETAGYEVTDATAEGKSAAVGEAEVWTNRRAIATWIGGVAVAAGLGVEFALPAANAALLSPFGRAFHVADVLFLFAVAASGRAILVGGYRSARNRSLDIDFLMSVAILGALTASVAFGESLYFEAATLAVLFSLAELLETYSMDRARDSLRELMELSPDEATVRRDGEEVTVPVDDVSVGEVVVVRPGEKVPMDGEVLEGQSAVDQAPITGESVPVDKTVGDEVFAGTINEDGYLEVRVTADASDNTLARIVQLVEDAQSNKTEREQFVERFAGYYTPVVVAFAVLVTLASPAALGTTWTTAFVYGLTLLVLACPCAFVISTPVSVVSGITSAAKNGVLVKGGNHLETMGAVDVVAFDKTGTLTRGELAVTDVVPLNGNTEREVLECARGLERRSEHPIGEAIVERSPAADGDAPPIEEFESITGKGVRADLGGTAHYAGKPGLFEELGFDLSHVHATTDGGTVTRTAERLCERSNCLDLLDETVPRLQDEGKTVVLVGTEDELEGVIAVADEVRPEATAAVRALRDAGVAHTVMLTGDNRRTARAIAAEVGIDDYRAELLPEEKVAAIESLQDDYGTVAMVGDGVNDAPALATADVGVAMGAAGTDTALETADIALMGDDLTRLPYLYELSRDANGVIRQNVWTSLGIKAALAVAVPFGLVPIWVAVLAGDAGMTLGVTGNAMRLSRIRPSLAVDGPEST